jgi:GTP-binding protein Era
MRDNSGFRCGFVAVVGRPNVGKSTLINAILGSKISIVSPKPQTTRHRILGVYTAAGCQIVFIDTPGLHRNAGKAMNRLMNRTAAAALADAEAVLFVCEAGSWRDEDQDVLERIRRVSVPVIAVLNKIDRVRPRARLLADIAAMSDRYDFDEIVPVSARRGDNLDSLLAAIPAYLPLSPPLFPVETVTDRSEVFRMSEIIREKLTLNLRDELPYGLTVQIERFEREDGRVVVHAIIWVERDSQKRIVIGKGGSMLKTVGRSARIEISRMLDLPVHLELWVKVKENWADSDKDLQSLGYDAP